MRDALPYRAVPFRDSIAEGGIAPICLLAWYQARSFWNYFSASWGLVYGERGRPWHGTSAWPEIHFTRFSPRCTPRVVPSTRVKPGRFGSFFVLCFLALGGHCLQMLSLPGFWTHANTQNLPHFRALPASIQEHSPPKCLFFMAKAKLPNRPGFALLRWYQVRFFLHLFWAFLRGLVGGERGRSWYGTFAKPRSYFTEDIPLRMLSTKIRDGSALLTTHTPVHWGCEGSPPLCQKCFQNMWFWAVRPFNEGGGPSFPGERNREVKSPKIRGGTDFYTLPVLGGAALLPFSAPAV